MEIAAGIKAAEILIGSGNFIAAGLLFAILYVLWRQKEYQKEYQRETAEKQDRAYRQQEAASLAQLEILKTISRLEEQIKTLFINETRHENRIVAIEEHCRGASACYLTEAHNRKKP